MQKLKRAVIKEELVALTGDFIQAIILNQFIYWSERVRDFDKFILEEKERAEEEGKSVDMPLMHGWIYKKAEDLAEEIMIDRSVSTMRRYIKALVKNGWIEERDNPHYAWDNTKQYRVNLLKLHNDLQSIGYILQGYKINMNSLQSPIYPNFQNENTEFQNENTEFQNEKTIPEITIRDYDKNNNNTESPVDNPETLQLNQNPQQDQKNVVVSSPASENHKTSRSETQNLKDDSVVVNPLNNKFKNISGTDDPSFISGLLDFYNPESIEKQLINLELYIKRNKVDNPQGFLLAALRGNWILPEKKKSRQSEGNGISEQIEQWKAEASDSATVQKKIQEIRKKYGQTQSH